MTDPSEPESFALLFTERTHHAPILIGTADVPSGSRIGGTAPEGVQPELTGGPLTYFFTLGADVLGLLIEAGTELSFFYRRDMEARLGATPGTEADLLTVIAHPAGRRAAESRELDSPLRGRSLTLGELARDRDVRGIVSLETKLGGAPGLIQEEPMYLEPVERRGLSFLLQISEENFPREMLVGSYLFYYGAVYVFTVFDRRTRRIDPSRMGSFFQH
jgi:hypothetical protein